MPSVEEKILSLRHTKANQTARDKEKPSFICSLSSLEKVVFGLHFNQRLAAYNTLGYLILWSHPGAVRIVLFTVSDSVEKI